MFDINLLAHAFSCGVLHNEQLAKFNRLESKCDKSNSRSDEELDLRKFINYLGVSNYSFYESFYYNFSIPRISKEFDLLRFGEEYIVNIEIKRTDNQEKIKKQLKQNRYYLSFLDIKDIYNFTFSIVGENDNNNFALYELIDDEIILVQKERLIELINNQKIKYSNMDINELFVPANYLVSPFNSTERFVNNEYFLTDNQDEIQRSILKDIDNNKKIITLEGDAGSGKTLLIYDMVKKLKQKNKRYAIIHCGLLNNGQISLFNDYQYQIFPIKFYYQIDFSKIDILIIDEGQRIREDQLDEIIDLVDKYNVTLLFSFDLNQVLCMQELTSDSVKHVRDREQSHHYLKNRVRCSEEITRLSEDLFDLKKRKPSTKYKNIQLVYMHGYDNAIKYIDYKTKESSWKYLNYTPSRYEKYFDDFEKLKNFQYGNAHSVIGQEYDNVIVSLDYNFFYNNEKELCCRNLGTPYIGTKMLYELITRARNKVIIVIIDNKNLYYNLLDMLTAF